jgi:hypothetical protein
METRFLLGIEALPVSLLLGFGYIITGKKVLSEHTHCDNAATNSKRENARSRMFGKFTGKREYGDKGR